MKLLLFFCSFSLSKEPRPWFQHFETNKRNATVTMMIAEIIKARSFRWLFLSVTWRCIQNESEGEGERKFTSNPMLSDYHLKTRLWIVSTTNRPRSQHSCENACNWLDFFDVQFAGRDYISRHNVITVFPFTFIGLSPFWWWLWWW